MPTSNLQSIRLLDLKKPTDLDLHCSLSQSMSCSAKAGLTYFSLVLNKSMLHSVDVFKKLLDE